MGAYRNVLVGTDGSPTATRAVDQAARLAASVGARLTIVTAYTRDPRHEREAAEAPEEVRWMVTDAGAATGTVDDAVRLARNLGATDVITRTASGDPADVLVEMADETGADVIVVGSKGMVGAARFVLGSVPNKVSHHAPCDVLIVQTV